MQKLEGQVEIAVSRDIETLLAELKSLGEMFQRNIRNQLQAGIVDSATVSAFMNIVSFQCVSTCKNVSAAIERFRADVMQPILMTSYPVMVAVTFQELINTGTVGPGFVGADIWSGFGSDFFRTFSRLV